MNRPIILCGLGRVGWQVLHDLRRTGSPIVVVDDRCAAGDPRLGDARLVRGDCRQPQVLAEAGLSDARGLLILTSDDLVNISTTLMVRHLNPAVRVVVRLFNQNLLPRLGKVVNNVVALSVSALTAPLIALIAQAGPALGTFQLGDSQRQIAELTVGEHSHLLGKTIAEAVAGQDVQVLAHFSTSGRERFLVDVDLSEKLKAGDQLVICSEPRRLTRLVAQAEEEDFLPQVLWAGFFLRQWRMIRRAVWEMDLALKICTLVLVGVILISTLLFSYGTGMSPIQGFYRTVSVMATGADMRGEELEEGWQRVFVSMLRLLGAALIAAFAAIVTNYLLRAHMAGALEVRRIPERGHIVICGLGNVGFRVAKELLDQGEQVVIIEIAADSRFVSTVRRMGAAMLIADATIPEVLQQARVATAHAIVLATRDELVNLEVALLAKEINPAGRIILRVTDPHLADTLHQADLPLAFSVPSLSAPAFVAALFGDHVQSVFLVRGQMLAVVDLIVIEGDSYLVGKTGRDIQKEYRLLPVALLPPDGKPAADIHQTPLTPGHRLTVVGMLNDLSRLHGKAGAE